MFKITEVLELLHTFNIQIVLKKSRWSIRSEGNHLKGSEFQALDPCFCTVHLVESNL